MSGGIRIGEAFIEVRADSGNAFSSISRQASQTGTSSGSALGSGLLSGVGNALGTITKIVGSTVGVVGGLFTAGAAKGGFDRLLNIDQAQSKLKGLGYSTQEIEGVMTSSLNSVSGTAYGLGDAVGIAAGALAAGVPQGDALQRTLSLVGDTAAIAGTDLNEMGTVFNQIAAVGKLTTENMQQLQDRGIPVLQYLADEYGVTAEEAQKMVTNGEISFDQFQGVIEKNIGGAAAEMGNSWSGGLANMKAASSRIGATLMEPFFGLAGTAFKALTPIFDAVNSALKPAMEAVGVALAPLTPMLEQFGTTMAAKIGPAITAVAQHLPGLATSFVNLISGAGPLAPILAIVGAAVAALSPFILSAVGAIAPFVSSMGGIGGAVGKLAPMLKLLGGPIGIIIGLLVAAYTSSEPFRNAINNLIGTVVGLATTIASALMPVFQMIVTTVMPAVTQIFNALVPVLTQVITVVTQVVTTLVSALMPIIMTLISTVLPPLIAIFNALVPVVMSIITGALMPLVNIITSALIPIINALMPVVQTVFGVITEVIGAAMTIVQGIIQTVTGIISGDWGMVWEGIKTIFSGIWDAIKAVITGAIEIVGAVIKAGLAIISTAWSTVWNAIKSVASSVWDGIKSLVSGALDAVKNAVSNGVNGIKNFFSDGFNALKGIASNAWNNVKSAVSDGVNGAIDLVRSLPGKAASALGNLGSTLAGSGRALIQGFKDGIMNAFGSVKDAVSGGLQSIRNLFPFSPAKEGPFSGKGYTSFSGKALSKDFAKGISSNAGMVEDATTDLLGMAQGNLDSNLSVSGVRAGRLSESGVTKAHGIIEQNNTVTNNYEITLDASSVKSFNDVVDMVQNLSQVARTGRGTTTTARLA